MACGDVALEGFVDKSRQPAEPPIPRPHEGPIPGGYESDTAAHREPGAMGGRFNGEDGVSGDADDLSDESVRREWRRIGGGDGSRRQKAED